MTIGNGDEVPIEESNDHSMLRRRTDKKFKSTQLSIEEFVEVKMKVNHGIDIKRVELLGFVKEM